MGRSLRCAAGFALLIVLASVAGCSAVPVRSHPSLSACRAYGVRAIEQRRFVQSVPPACEGLSRAEVNQAVGSAIRQAVGPLPKAAGRGLAVADGRYLAPLIRAVPPSAPQSSVTGAAIPASATAAEYGALGCWLATLAAGLYLALRMLGRRGVRHRGKAARLPVVVLAHGGVALTGLIIWIAFIVVAQTWLAWVGVGLTTVIAGLGMATLIGGLPEPEASRRAAPSASPRRSRVLVIATHGALATATITLVVLAAIAA
jgi:manganese efflux pump family protein